MTCRIESRVKCRFRMQSFICGKTHMTLHYADSHHPPLCRALAGALHCCHQAVCTPPSIMQVRCTATIEQCRNVKNVKNTLLLSSSAVVLLLISAALQDGVMSHIKAVVSCAPRCCYRVQGAHLHVMLGMSHDLRQSPICRCSTLLLTSSR